jgi:hypothetical protein
MQTVRPQLKKINTAAQRTIRFSSYNELKNVDAVAKKPDDRIQINTLPHP